MQTCFSAAVVCGAAVATFGVDAVLAADTPKKMEIQEAETPKIPDPLPEGWVTCHQAHPGPGSAYPGVPNAAIFHQGRYHVHFSPRVATCRSSRSTPGR